MSFAAPLLLGALASIAIPVILHLMAKDVPKTVKFSALRFLSKDKLETQSKKGIRDLLLLIMRCLVIAGLVFAFSRPFVPVIDANLGEAKEVVILLDNSASMNRADLLDATKSKILELVEDGDSVALCVSSNGLESKIDFGSKDDLEIAISNLKLTLYEGRHEEALNEAIVTFHKEARSKKLIVVSDFQSTDWNIKQLPDLAKDVEVRLFNPFEQQSENISLYVDRVRRLNAGKVIQAQIITSNNTSSEYKGKLTFSAGQKVVEKEIFMNVGETIKTVLTMENPDASKAKIVIDAQDDFKYDNEFHIWLGDEAPITVAFPEGEQQTLDFIFVKKALQEVKAGDASFRVNAVDSQLFSGADLQDYQAVILTDSAHNLQSDVYESMKDYVANGGLLIVAPAQRAGMIFSRLKAHELADVRFSKTVKRKSSIDLPFKFEEMVDNSPILELFDKTQDSDLQQFPIYSYNEMTIGGSGKSLLEITKGTPGIALFPNGKGNVLVSAIPFNHIWSDFTISNSFLPFLRQIIISKAATEENSVLKLKVGEKKLISGSFDDYIDTSIPGVFVSDEIPIVVNVSRNESTATKVNPIDLKAQLKQGEGNRVAVKNKEEKSVQYWHYFFLLAVLALIVECLLADLKATETAQ